MDSFFSRSSKFVYTFVQFVAIMASIIAKDAGHVFLVISTFSATRKLITPSMYRRSCKTFVTTHWTHFTVNSICIMSFIPRITNSGMLLHKGRFHRQPSANDVTVTSLFINFLQNVYFGFFIFIINDTASFLNLFIEWPSYILYEFHENKKSTSNLWSHAIL